MKLQELGSRISGPATLFIISVILLWKLVLTNQYTWLDGPDLAHQVLPWWVFQAGEWHAGRIPLWDPHHWAGQTLIGQAQPGVAYPLNWILFLLPLRRGWMRMDVLHWYFVLIHFIAAVNMYALCRWLRFVKSAAIFGGTLFAFTGFLGTNDWPQMLNGGIWAPLVFLFLLRVVNGERPWSSAAWSGFFLGLSWLSGHHQIPIFLSLVTVGTWIGFTWRDRRLLKFFAVFLVFTALFSALQVLPAFEYGRSAKRWVGLNEPVGWRERVPYNIHQQYSFKPESLYGIVFPSLAVHTNGYVGWVGMVFAGLGAAAAIRDRRHRIWIAIAMAGLLLALGSDSLLHGLVYAIVPMVEKARSPSTAIFVFNFGVAVLSAYGLHTWTSNVAWFRRVAIALFGIFAAVWAFGFAAAMYEKVIGQGKPLLSTLIAAALGVVLWMAYRGILRPQVFTLAIFGLLLLELPLTVGAGLPNRYEQDRTFFLKKVPEFEEFARIIKAKSNPPPRFYADSELVPYNAGDYYGIDMLNGYLASLSQNILALESYTARAQELLATEYYIGKQAPSPKHQLLAGKEQGLKLYFNPDAVPRARVVARASSVAAVNEINTLIADETKDFRSEAWFVGDAPKLPACSQLNSGVRYQRWNSGEVQLQVLTNCSSLLVLADTYDKGWKAKLDGKPVRLWEVYGALRAVELPPGEHVVEMVYRPASVIAGAVAAVLGLVGLAVLSLLRL